MAKQVPLERVSGAARLVVARKGVADLYQRAPCRILFPTPQAGDPLTAVLLTTSGGLTGGDRLAIEIDICPGAECMVTTQAAEKAYRSLGDDCEIGIRVAVGEGASAEWLMQETILFDGARLRRVSDLDVAAGGRLLAVESIVFGRRSMGEDFNVGLVHDAWRVKRCGRLAWFDAMRLEGDVAEQRRQPFGFGDAAGAATMLYVGEDAARWINEARRLIGESAAQGGATMINGVLVARLLSADAAALRTATAHVVSGLRSRIFGRAARMPRVWSV